MGASHRAGAGARDFFEKPIDVKELGASERGAGLAPTPSTLAEYVSLGRGSAEATALRQILELGVRLVGADEGSLLIRDPNAAELVFAVTAGNSASERTLAGQRVPLGAGITGLAAKERAVHFGAPAYHEVQQSDDRGPEAVMAAPVVIGGEVAGVITAVSFAREKRFNANDARLYEQVAGLTSATIQQRRRVAPASS